jgi:hypothetical protein
MLHIPYYVRLGYESKTQYRNHRKALKAFRQSEYAKVEDDFSDSIEA